MELVRLSTHGVPMPTGSTEKSTDRSGMGGSVRSHSSSVSKSLLCMRVHLFFDLVSGWGPLTNTRSLFLWRCIALRHLLVFLGFLGLTAWPWCLQAKPNAKVVIGICIVHEGLLTP